MKVKIERLITLLTVILLIFSMCSCGSVKNKECINIAVLKGPTGIGAARLMEENNAGKSQNSYSFTVAGAADEITAGMVSGSLDIAAVPTNLASVLYNKTDGNICLLAVNTLGVLYVLEKGESIKSINDLQNRKIVSSGEGTVAQYVVEYILSQNGVQADIHYASEHTEAAALAVSGEYDTVIVPEPFVTAIMQKDSSFRIAVDITQQWNNLGKGQLVMGVIAARKEFVQDNPHVVAAFSEEYKNSIAYANNDTDGAAILCEKYGIIEAEVAKKAIPNSHIVFIDGDEMKNSVSDFLEQMYSFNPSCVGGTVPDSDFYHIG